MAKRNDYRSYKKKFDMIIKNEEPIFDDHGKRLKIEPDEKFVQCYDRNHPVRKSYPKYVFVSNKGNLVSVHGKKPRWLSASYTSNGRESYKLSVKGNAKSSIGYIYVAVCHNSFAYGKANKIMEEKGKGAFKKPEADDPFRGEYLNVHHEKGYDAAKGRAYNNNPETLMILTINVHALFDNIPAEDAPYSEQVSFMREVCEVLSEEEPNRISLFVPGDEKKTGYIKVYDITKEISDAISKSFFLGKNLTVFFYPLTDDPECLDDLMNRMEELTNIAMQFYMNDNSDDRFQNTAETKSGKQYEYQMYIRRERL